MRVGVDIRCLQDRFRTGVGEYVWQTLKVLSAHPDIKLYGFANAARHIDLPANIDQHLFIRRSHLPNKIMNLLFSFKLGPTIDSYTTDDNLSTDVFWLPNPNFVNLSQTVPVVLTVHDLSFIHYPHYFAAKGRWWYFPYIRRLLKRGLGKYFWVAAVSQHTADDIYQLFPNLRKRLRVMPPGLDQRYFSVPSVETQQCFRHKYNLPDQYLLTVGTIEPRKNYQLLLLMYDQLIRQQPSWPYDLVIAGAWGWKFGKLKKMLNRLSCRSRIRIIGYIADEDKPSLYAGAVVFLYPSLYEGIGLPVLEAMATGRAVMVSHSSSLPEIVATAGILLPPDQIEAWLATLKWLVADESARQDLARAGRDRASLFSWQKTAAAYQKLFKEAATTL